MHALIEAHLLDEFDYWRTRSDVILVEGAGGLLSPLGPQETVADLAADLGFPLVVVARNALGTINHTLLTLHAARSAGLNVAGVVINRFRSEGFGPNDEPMSHDEQTAMLTNPQQLSFLGKVEVLTLVPSDPETSVEEAQIGRATQLAIDKVNWTRLTS